MLCGPRGAVRPLLSPFRICLAKLSFFAENGIKMSSKSFLPDRPAGERLTAEAPNSPEPPMGQSVPTWFARVCASRPDLAPRWRELGKYLILGDPLADELAALLASLLPGHGRSLFNQALSQGIASLRRPPAALRAFFEAAETVPRWVDWDLLERGGEVFLRAGPLCAIALGCLSLPQAYAIPDGNKPLVFSGRLVHRASRRLAETGRFIDVTCAPGGLRRFAPGYQTTLRVRLMHAQVRRLLLQSERWSVAELGVPINQVHLSLTNILFSAEILAGVRRLGMSVADDDAQALMVLWRYSGHLSGVVPELAAESEQEALRFKAAILDISLPPDEDARLLTRALMEAPIRLAYAPLPRRLAAMSLPLQQALARYLLGDPLADQLELPKSRAASLLPRLFVLAMRVVTFGARLVPGGRGLAHRLGHVLWRRLMDNVLTESKAATFALPSTLSPHTPEED